MEEAALLDVAITTSWFMRVFLSTFSLNFVKRAQIKNGANFSRIRGKTG